MFANNAIKSFKETIITKKWDGLTNKNMSIMIKEIPNAQKYHLGNEGLLNMVNDQIKKYQIMLRDMNLNFLKKKSFKLFINIF